MTTMHHIPENRTLQGDLYSLSQSMAFQWCTNSASIAVFPAWLTAVTVQVQQLHTVNFSLHTYITDATNVPHQLRYILHTFKEILTHTL
jgi:hypothetical protein